MTFGWIHVVLIFCWFTTSSQTDDNDEFQIVCVSENATVNVPCPPSAWSTKRFTFHLYKGHMKVQQTKLNATVKEGALRLDGDLWLHFNPHNVSFVFPAQKETCGAYVCVAEQVYPPPSRKTFRTLMVLLNGQHCPLTSAGSNEVTQEKGCDKTTFDVQFWTLGLGVSTFVGLVSTIIAVIFWIRLKRAESYHNDYINTKPRTRGLQARNRGGGVQHPAPKHF